MLDIPEHPLDPAHPFSPPLPGIELVDVTSGGVSRLRTAVSLFHHRQILHVLFTMEDDPEIVATYRKRDEPIYEEDVVEVFLAPQDRHHYFELEANPLGTLFDARIHSPEGRRATMSTDLAWNCDGYQAWVRRERTRLASRLSILLSIPLRSLGPEPPPRGAVWMGNLFRIDRSPGGDQFLAWQPTGRTPPDFHVPDAFGQLRFA